MHELSITQSMVDVVKRELSKQSNSLHIKKVTVQIGKLTGVVPDCVRFYFSFLIKGTVLEGAQLEIKEVPVRLFCNQCDNNFVLDEVNFVCPRCGKSDLKMNSGRELFVESIETEEHG